MSNYKQLTVEFKNYSSTYLSFSNRCGRKCITGVFDNNNQGSQPLLRVLCISGLDYVSSWTIMYSVTMVCMYSIKEVDKYVDLLGISLEYRKGGVYDRVVVEEFFNDR